ncbi:hypothetical protein CC1G_13154 [Coprinopsis cinerea okayama7|uniref:2OGFeDO JBP1/TET oxygenase domain-containing protein n=1 Tax=Coprinopsis cinerea (strain Okayama-7 / 130 / ATCC MYA-4618 / FGSC 9003) TaxID=240176 RepID=A8P3E6_COPC7|nr:hypothetical protein CC1G_13154 [Coprinopsis cinerea okayama7\|eukprot:XP_001838534.2 hypothetical protein CC1G_13154 [Coprinopsis cinerea okayama7\
MESSRPPLPPGCRLVQRLACYILRLVREQLSPGHPPTEWPADIPLRLQIECHRIVAVVVRAFRDAEQLEWSVSDFKALQGTLTETQLLARFPPAFPRKRDGTAILKDEPFIIVDKAGRILMWYLPNIISATRREIILDAIKWLSYGPSVSPLSASSPQDRRKHNGTFTESTSDVRSGVATFASCWPTLPGDPEHSKSVYAPSSTFLDPNQGGLDFLERISESLAVLGAILAAINPAQFEAGLDVLASLDAGIIKSGNRELLQRVLKDWSTPFTAFSVVNNRDTEPHRDLKSPSWAYDLLYTDGFYIDGRLEVTSLGVRCRYNPGTVVALIASVFVHGIAPVQGSRVGISQFFRQVMVEQTPFSRLPRPLTFHDYAHFFKGTHFFA